MFMINLKKDNVKDISLILNPFDIVKVEHENGSYSFGMIEDISHII